MMANGRPQMGVVAVAAPIGWKILLNVGLPLLVGAGAVYATGAAVKSAVPDIPINKKGIGKAALWGGLGAAAYYSAPLFEEKYRPYPYIAAALAVGVAVYSIFQEVPQATTDIIQSKTVSPAEQVPPMTPGPMLDAFTIVVDPEQNNTDGTRRWPSGDQRFEVVVKNNLNKNVTFFVGGELSDEDGKKVYESPLTHPVYERKKITLGPGKDQAVIITIPSPKDIMGPIKGSFRDMAFTFNFYRDGTVKTPFRSSDSVSSTFTLLPWG